MKIDKNEVTLPDGKIENTGMKTADWGLYKFTNGVTMSSPIGFSHWLLSLGFHANYYEVLIIINHFYHLFFLFF